MISRRAMLTVLISSLPLWKIVSVKKKKKYFRVQFETIFPRAMTFSEYKEIKKNFENQKLSEILEENFRLKKLISDVYFEFNGVSCFWRADFKDEDAYNYWLQCTQMIGSHNAKFKQEAGFLRIIKKDHVEICG